jgi:hypothetical protein
MFSRLNRTKVTVFAPKYLAVTMAESSAVASTIARNLIPQGELRHFQGKHVRIFADADGPGLQAESRWWRQLGATGARVDGYSFSGFIRSDGQSVKDLNDFALIDPDQWEAKREAIEEAFSFST